MRQASPHPPLFRSLPAALLGTLLVLTGLAAGDLLRLIRVAETIWSDLLILRHHLLHTLEHPDLAIPRAVCLLTGAMLLGLALLVSLIRSRRRAATSPHPESPLHR